MKSKFFTVLIAAVATLAALTSCSGGSKGPSPLIAQSERLALDLGSLAEESPMFLQTVAVDYADAKLSVGITFADPKVNVAEYSEALVQYALAQYMKEHTGKNLDEIINTLSAEKGSLDISLSDTRGTSRTYSVSATRMKQLVKAKAMELNYNDVRTNVTEIMAGACAAYKDEYNADDCEFAIAGGFAQYTLTFGRASAYSSLNQASLTGRYLKVIQTRYEEFGACRHMIEELLRSLSIDGYRFVYTDKADTKTLSAGMPWRLIDK